MVVHAWCTRAILAAATIVAASEEMGPSKQCKAVFANMDKYNDFEVRALCRAQFPPKVCDDAGEVLADRPWTADRVQAACDRWAAMWPSDRTGRLLKAVESTTTEKPAGIASAEASGFCESLYEGTPLEGHSEPPSLEAYAAALKSLDMDAVKAEMEALLTDSKDCWPADFGNYGPFFVRLAWHCAGSYRDTDGKGGCGGGRQRFEPERSWPDNTNLDKARALVAPLKRKYGDALSWGDLFILAGTTALRSMGTPIKQMCFGRIDDADGTKSMPLGPSSLQEKEFPCKVNGRCTRPLGPTTVGLVYVNPEGPVTEEGGKPNPDPAESAKDIRDSFTRMGHDDRGTVALVGGGHAFGKAHGACPAGAGPSPSEAFGASPQGTPWPGRCGTGKGKDAFTAGFEGPWTTAPLKWDNEYFKYLLEHKWEKHIGPGGHYQWRIQNATGTAASLMRLTADLALLHDDKYLEIVKEFAANHTALSEAFDEAWFKLTVQKGNTWSQEAKCDFGAFPEELKTVMLAGDLTVESAGRPEGPATHERLCLLASAGVGVLIALGAVLACRRLRHGAKPEDAAGLLAA